MIWRYVKILIYKIENLINGKIYIGKTSRSLSERKIEHLSDSRVGSELPIHRAIRKYGSESFTFEVIDNVDNLEELNVKEMYWINHYKSYDKGYNASRGGDGAGAGENHHMYGKHGSDNPNSVSILQLSLDGKFIKRHESQTDGAKYVNGNRGNITSCCQNKITHVYNSIWIYESDYNDRYVLERVKSYNDKILRNAVVKLTKDGIFIQDYTTAKSGALAVNGYGSSITACCKCKPKYHMHKGYIWMYLSDYKNEEFRKNRIERVNNRWKS